LSKIVISYRRSDSDVFAGRVRDRIASRFGDQSVFLDIDDIPLGKDFRVHIQDALSQSDVVVVVIGPKWLGPIKRGAARINDDTDPVRIEVEVALAKGLPIIPILVGNTGMPSASQLPASIREFSYVNAAKVDTGRDFHRDMDRVILSLTVLTARSPETTDPGTIKRLTITPVAAVRTRTRLSAVSLAGIVCLFVAAIAATAWSFRIDLLGSMERQQAAKVPGTPNDPPSATSPGPSVASITAAPTPSGPDRSMVTHAPAPAASALKSPPAQPATNAVDPAVEFALAANHSSPHAAPASDSAVPAADSRVGIAPPHSAKAGDMGAEITTPPDQQAASVAPSAPSVRRVPSDPPPATLLLQSLTNPRLLKNEWPSLDLQSIPFRRSILRSGGVTGRLPQP
jgi:TIR domain